MLRFSENIAKLAVLKGIIVFSWKMRNFVLCKSQVSIVRQTKVLYKPLFRTNYRMFYIDIYMTIFLSVLNPLYF